MDQPLDHLTFMATAMARSSFEISEKAGLEFGSDDQHLSINDLQLGSHQFGVLGRRVPLIMPAENITVECISTNGSIKIKQYATSAAFHKPYESLMLMNSYLWFWCPHQVNQP